MMTAQPVPVQLFRDRNNGRLYRIHYMGMGESIAVESSELQAVVDDLFHEGRIVQNVRQVGCEETRRIHIDGMVKLVPTPNYRSGYLIEVLLAAGK